MIPRPRSGLTGGTRHLFSGAAALLAALALPLVQDCGPDESTATPAWQVLPTVTLYPGSSALLDLNDYVEDADTADEQLTLSVIGASSDAVSAVLEPSSHLLTLSSASSFEGEVTLEVEATDPEANSSSTTLSVVVTAAPSSSSLAFISLSDGASYTNPVSLTASASSDVRRVQYYSPYNNQEYLLGESSDAGALFPVTYSFSTLGSRQVTARGYDAAGTLVASATVYITVVSGGSSVSFVSPVNGDVCSPTVWFRSSGSTDIVRVQYSSLHNGSLYLLGESSDKAQQFPVSYTFNTLGSRQLTVEGFSSSGVKVATASITLQIEAEEEPEPEGRLGAWLWYIEGTGYTHTQLADRLAALGVRRLFIKVADGTSVWPEASNTSIPDIYQARGIEAWAWSYNYPNNYSTQANALSVAARTGYDGYVLDIESEFDGQANTLHSLLGAFRDARAAAASAGYIPSSGWPMNVTTWGNPEDHGMRIDIIDQYVDAHMPQTYLEVWGSSYMADPSYWVNVGTAEYVSLGATRPIHHIVSTEYDDITAGQIDEVFATSGPESSIWRVPGTETPTSIWDTWEEVDWHMYDVDAAQIQWVSPVDDGWYTPELWLKVTADTSVKKVIYYAGTYYLGESTDAAGQYALRYSFNTMGERTVTAYGYDSSGTLLGSRSVSFVISDGSSDTSVIEGVPYYFQYENAYNPSGSCQNTSLAMLLSFYGCPVTPDTISYAWGTDYAQSPSGLATVFNSYASSCRIDERLRAHTDGGMEDVNALLAAGKPVIVHGYFTSYGHVLVLVGFDGTYYTANDPAGRWTEVFKGGYYSSDNNDGRYIEYDEYPVYQAINTLDGRNQYPIWYHEIYLVN